MKQNIKEKIIQDIKSNIHNIEYDELNVTEYVKNIYGGYNVHIEVINTKHYNIPKVREFKYFYPYYLYKKMSPYNRFLWRDDATSSKKIKYHRNIKMMLN